jgi:hypothetical protein
MFRHQSQACEEDARTAATPERAACMSVEEVRFVILLKISGWTRFVNPRSGTARK